MNDLFGVKIVESPYLKDGEMVALGEFEKPPTWDTMTEWERMAYAVARGSVVMVKNLDVLRSMRQ